MQSLSRTDPSRGVMISRQFRVCLTTVLSQWDALIAQFELIRYSTLPGFMPGHELPACRCMLSRRALHALCCSHFLNSDPFEEVSFKTHASALTNHHPAALGVVFSVLFPAF